MSVGGEETPPGRERIPFLPISFKSGAPPPLERHVKPLQFSERPAKSDCMIVRVGLHEISSIEQSDSELYTNFRFEVKKRKGVFLFKKGSLDKETEMLLLRGSKRSQKLEHSDPEYTSLQPGDRLTMGSMNCYVAGISRDKARLITSTGKEVLISLNGIEINLIIDKIDGCKRQIEIGRSAGGEAKVEGDLVSRHHAVVFIDKKNGLWLVDLVSGNGTWVIDQNNKVKRLEPGEPWELEHRDEIIIGRGLRPGTKKLEEVRKYVYWNPERMHFKLVDELPESEPAKDRDTLDGLGIKFHPPE